MKMKEIKEMTDKEMGHLLDELQKEKFNLHIQSKTGQLQNPAKLRQIRRDIARIKTEKTGRDSNVAAPASA
ncbi:MAG: 50S ribosomal protein L29 [Lentisphaerae bacterium GWF2_52_8]|nr:MAG: 50S ribosomal protein L29 [Lentisphaerae bacterium GWF2_52_8]